MKKQLSISKPDGQVYLGRELLKQGYIGKTDVYINAVTILITKPGTTLKNVLKSLEITKSDIELRLSSQGKK